METVTLDMIHRDLEFVKRELMEIKARMVDMDRIITEDDYNALQPKFPTQKSKPAS